MALKKFVDTNHGRAKVTYVDEETGLSATGRERPWFSDVDKRHVEIAESRALERLAEKTAEQAKKRNKGK